MTMKKNKLLTLFISFTLLTACGEDKKTTEQKPAETMVESTAVQESADKASPTETVEEITAENPEMSDGIDAPLAFALTNLDGEIVKAADYRGKWLVLNYWATWCAPCRDEMPELVRFQNEHDNVQILGIAYEDAEIHKLKSFAADFNINYPLLTIDVYNPPKFAEEGGLGLPTTIVYNPEGMRHKKHMGPIDADGLAEMIQ